MVNCICGGAGLDDCRLEGLLLSASSFWPVFEVGRIGNRRVTEKVSYFVKTMHCLWNSVKCFFCCQYIYVTKFGIRADFWNSASFYGCKYMEQPVANYSFRKLENTLSIYNTLTHFTGLHDLCLGLGQAHTIMSWFIIIFGLLRPKAAAWLWGKL